MKTHPPRENAKQVRKYYSPCWSALSPQPQTCNQVTVPLNVILAQVLQQPAATADEQQQTTAGVVIVLVVLEAVSYTHLTLPTKA